MTGTNTTSHYFYVSRGLDMGGHLEDKNLAGFTERHKVSFKTPLVRTLEDPLGFAASSGASGIVIEMDQGWAGKRHLRLARRALKSKLRVFFHWPDENAVECIDDERLSSLWRHWVVIKTYYFKERIKRVSRRLVRKVVQHLPTFSRPPEPADKEVQEPARDQQHEEVGRFLLKVNELRKAAVPVQFQINEIPSVKAPLNGTGAYLRLDFWARINSGGSYGHTCYVAKELSNTCEQFVSLMAHRYDLMDQLGINQVVLEEAAKDGCEINLVRASEHYYCLLKPVFEAVRPRFIYERICLGNYVGAMLSRELDIPYIVEYNGSEISMKKSFDTNGYEYEDYYLAVEELAFKQATLISVVSEPIRNDLIEKGVDPDKILINPNGVDIETYSPVSSDERRKLQRELGFEDGQRVIGFTGTFGGWHGIDVLAEAIPKICERAPNARFLLIGDGNYKHLVDSAVAQHGLAEKVVRVGRVSQQEGARLMGACDIFVSPHSSNMVDSRFFGSPTKVFEYMSMGSGIVASDLEQIGEVLSPAFYSNQISESHVGGLDTVSQKAVLCTPGSVDEFIDATSKLVKNDKLSERLGKNARRAAKQFYSWRNHVNKLWYAVVKGIPERTEHPTVVNGKEKAKEALRRIMTNDAYKEEVQNQWNNDACGSHYAKTAKAKTLDWYEEIESYRYDVYAPWMHDTMEFAEHSGDKVLEIGGGMGTDLAQFAKYGADVTDLDLSGGHLKLADENFRLRGLKGKFIHHDAEELPFEDNSFDVVYSNGVIHHTPNTKKVVSEIFRVLKPGGKVIVMVYAENSLHYWRNLVRDIGLRQNELAEWSIGEIMSRSVEITENDARPLVKVYTHRRLRAMFDNFKDIKIVKRQLIEQELPPALKRLSLPVAGKIMGWNLVVKATKGIPS